MITFKHIRSVAASLESLCMSVRPPKAMESIRGLCNSVVLLCCLIDISLSSSLSQKTLDGIVSTKHHVPEFTTAGLLNYIIELVVCEDEVRLA
jgi:hypothetical protein